MPRFFRFSTQQAPPPVVKPAPAGLGTFGGVYTPSILTILGVIMYLRFGWVVGNVGLLGTLVIVTLSTSITLLTSLSISAIATDQIVRAGGAYYMISRSLGIETGGAVGIPLYFAQAFSVALYTIGFAESIVKEPGLNQTIVALVVTIAVAALALKSAAIAIKAQYWIMAAIVLSLVSFWLGSPLESTSTTASLEGLEKVGFWTVFAVFFPAVTGIMSGVNMSGDLRDPSRSIPIGTLAAVGTGYIIYMGLPVLLHSRADTATLVSDPLVMQQIAWWGWAILLGVWGATLSSALGSILGAPRVLQALARDGILPKKLRWLGHGNGPTDEPRIGTAFTLGIVLAVVCLGDLDLIAPILTMFFLTTYTVLNVAAGVEGFLQSPSFRPTFKVHWAFSLMGALGCMAVMFLIDALATVMAISIVLGIYLWLERRELESTWGDVRRGIWMTLVRIGLFNIGDTADPRNWRPHVLVFSGAPKRRLYLIELATALTHNRGLITVSSIVTQSSQQNTSRRITLETTIREFLDRQGIEAFVKVVAAPDPFSGAERLVETYGLGPLIPNTVLLGATENPEQRDAYCRMITNIHQEQRNVLILREHPDRGFKRRRRIDVWWRGLQANGGLMLILSYLLRTSLEWRGAEVCLKLMVPNPEAAKAARKNMEAVVQQLRIGATPQVLVAEGRPFEEILQESSKSADLVFLGIRAPEEDFSDYYQELQRLTAGLPTTVFVLAAQDLEFAEILQRD